MTDRAATAAIVAGYTLAVPFSIFLPGFLRLWRHREPALFVASETGVALIVLGWSLKGDTQGAMINGGWGVLFAAAYALEGRKRRRTASG
jgi:hypothetical protein